MGELEQYNGDKNIQKPASCMGFRHVQVLLLFGGLLLSYTMRVNMSIAIVAMTDSYNPNSFDWSIGTQSIILSSFFWGYVMLQVPASMLARKFGSMKLITASLAGNSVCSLLLPLAAYYGGWKLVCGCRVMQGLLQGFLYPCIHDLISKWIPLDEKSRMGTVIYSGGQLGTALQLMTSGFVAEYWGWAAIFYLNGCLGVIWVVAYVFLGADSPEKSTIISHEERLYVQNSLGHVGGHKKLPMPWKNIWTSVPFYALIFVHCGQNWGFWTLMTEMPSYFSKVLGVDLKSNGVVSAIPYLVMYVLGFPLGFMSDYILKKNWLSISASRKLSNTIGHWLPAAALLGLTFSPLGNVPIAELWLILAVGFNAGHYTGFLLVHIDMAPNFAGTLIGITNSISNVISIIAPLAAGAIIVDETDPADWKKVFYLSALIYFVANLVFIIFGSSVRQAWNEPKNSNSGTYTDNIKEKTEEKVV